jgi:hypothetical protein
MVYKLNEGEKLINSYRAHELTLLPTVLEVFVLIFVPWFFAIRDDFLYGSQSHLQLFMVWTLIVAAFASSRFIYWWLNYWQLTSKRLIHIQIKNFFKRNESGIELNKINSIDCVSKGYFAKLFNYGEITIKSAEQHDDLQMVNMEAPEYIKKAILSVHNLTHS